MLLHEGKALYPTTPQGRVERARYLLDQVRDGLLTAATAARELYDGAYWHDLGYATFAVCVRAELGRGKTQAYALLSETSAPSSANRTTGEVDFTYRTKQRARRRAAVVSPTPASPAGMLTAPFPGLQRFLVERDGRGWRLVVAFRDANGATQLVTTYHDAYPHALAALARSWSA